MLIRVGIFQRKKKNLPEQRLLSAGRGVYFEAERAREGRAMGERKREHKREVQQYLLKGPLQEPRVQIRERAVGDPGEGE